MRQEVEEAITKFRHWKISTYFNDRKSLGIDRMPGELIEYGGQPLTNEMQTSQYHVLLDETEKKLIS